MVWRGEGCCISSSQTLFGNSLRETLFRLSPGRGAKQSFADGVPKQSLVRGNEGTFSLHPQAAIKDFGRWNWWPAAREVH